MKGFLVLSFLSICLFAPAVGSVILCLQVENFEFSNLLFNAETIPLWVFAPFFTAPFTLLSFIITLGCYRYTINRHWPFRHKSIFLFFIILLSSQFFPLYLSILSPENGLFLLKNFISSFVPGLLVAIILTTYASKSR